MRNLLKILVNWFQNLYFSVIARRDEVPTRQSVKRWLRFTELRSVSLAMTLGILMTLFTVSAHAALQSLTTLEAETMPTKTTGGAVTGGWNIWSNGYIQQPVSFPATATYEFQILARGDYAGGAWPIMELRVDQVVKKTFTVNTSNWTYYNTQITVSAGSHNVAIAFTNDYYVPPADRNLYVDKVNILQVVPDAPSLAAPVLNNPVAGNAQVSLSWSSVTGATGYKVTYTSTTSTTIDAGNVTQYTVTGLTNGTSYSFKVKAYNATLQSADSNTKTATPQPPPLAAPVLSDPVPGNQQVPLAWNSIAGASGYKVTYSNNNGTTTTTNYTQDASCVAAYTMDETSGNIVDLCGNNDPGTISGSVLQNVTGKYNKGIEFKGVYAANNAYVSLGSGSSLDNLVARTIVAWVKPDNLGDESAGVILSKNYQDGWVLRLAAGNKLAFSQAFSGGVVTWTTTTAPIVLGSFQHIAVRYSAATTSTVPEIYVNGVKQTVSGGSPYGSRDNDGAYALNMGIAITTQEFDGVIDEVGVFNRVLTEAEIIELMTGGLTGSTQSGTVSTTVDAGNVTSYTVTGLTNGTKYDFKVKAYNAAEQGPDSNTKSARPHVAMEFVKNVNYNAAGQIVKVEYGNGTVTNYTYDPLTLRLTNLKTTDKNNLVIQNLSYQYDSVGNIRTITDAVHFDSQAFQYDALNRLTQAVGDNYGTKAYAYDEIGNITSKEGITYTYCTGAACPPAGGGPHAVTALSDGTTYAYDANGNMVSRNKAGVVRTFEYDVENRLLKVKEGGNIIEEYEYDGDGGRTKKTTYPAAGGVEVTKFVGSLFEETNTRQTEHLFLGGKRVASVTNGEVVFIHENHLGSANILTDVDGLIKELIEYKPYGEFARHEKYGSSEEVARFYFTGKMLDEKTGLYYFGARYYDPSLGRFITPDTIVQDPGGNPQTLNRYSYAGNNPVNNVDPSGHFWKKFWKSFVGAVVGVVAAVVTAGLSIGFTALAQAGWAGVSAGAWAVGGAIGGATTAALNGASGIGILQGAAFGGALGGLGGWAAGLNNGFGNAILGGMLAGGVANAAVSGDWGSFAGSLTGGISGGMLAMGAVKAHYNHGSRVDKLAGQLANDGNLAGDNVGANFAKSILELNQEPNILAKIAMIDRVTAVVDKGIWWSTFGRSFVDGVANSTYIDGGATFAAPGTLKPAFKIGFRISSKGLDGYYGFGLGSGSGASLTVNTSMGASNSIYAGVTAKGGTGIYGYSLVGSEGLSGGSVSGGVGWGIGNGVNVGATHRIRLWGF